MKRVLINAVVVAGITMVAGSALAQSQGYCDQYARSEMERLYPTGGGAVQGIVGGGIIGGLIAGVAGGNVGQGIGVGAAGGLVVGSLAWQQRRQEVYNAAFNNCMYSAQQVAAPPPPPPPPPPMATPYWARTTASAQNVRSHPTTNGSTVLFTVNPTMVFQMLICDNPEPGWCWIDLNGANGWISRSLTVPVS